MAVFGRASGCSPWTLSWQVLSIVAQEWFRVNTTVSQQPTLWSRKEQNALGMEWCRSAFVEEPQKGTLWLGAARSVHCQVWVCHLPLPGLDQRLPSWSGLSLLSPGCLWAHSWQMHWAPGSGAAPVHMMGMQQHPAGTVTTAWDTETLKALSFCV